MLPKNRRVPIGHFPKNSRVALRTKHFFAKAVKNDLAYNRLGVITGRAVGSAVSRNRLRRMIMDFFRGNCGFWEKTKENGHDVVIIIAPRTGETAKHELTEELKNYGRLF